jgi:hypothetical protein
MDFAGYDGEEEGETETELVLTLEEGDEGVSRYLDGSL